MVVLADWAGGLASAQRVRKQALLPSPPSFPDLFPHPCFFPSPPPLGQQLLVEFRRWLPAASSVHSCISDVTAGIIRRLSPTLLWASALAELSSPARDVLRLLGPRPFDIPWWSIPQSPSVGLWSSALQRDQGAQHCRLPAPQGERRQPATPELRGGSRGAGRSGERCRTPGPGMTPALWLAPLRPVGPAQWPARGTGPSWKESCVFHDLKP